MTKLQTVLSIILFHGSATYGTSFEFLAMGDWGGMEVPPYYTPEEKLTAEYMGEVASEYNPQFVLAIGDNFYHEGVTNVHDKRFNDV